LMYNEKLGKLDDILFDYDNCTIAYGILSVGGFLGIGDDLYAIPWKAFKLSEHKDYLILDADKEKLEKAPSFDKGKWPDIDKREWHTDIHTYYAMQPYWRYAGGHMSDPDTSTPDKKIHPRRNKTHL